MSLSVIIPTLNEMHFLPRLISDLNSQECEIQEIIIADGGSTDGTDLWAKGLGLRLAGGSSGRGAQMNAGAKVATGETLLFLHSDSTITDPTLLKRALAYLHDQQEHFEVVAGHFSLEFDCPNSQKTIAHRFAEKKSSFNRQNSVNGDQGLLISAQVFKKLGGYSEQFHFLEDQAMCELIRSRGKWVTLPGVLLTSNRRFEVEGIYRRFILASMLMGIYSAGIFRFFEKAPQVYANQDQTHKLMLTPFFEVIWGVLKNDYSFWERVKIWFRFGRYVHHHDWQLFHWLDTILGTRFWLKTFDKYLVYISRIFIWDLIVTVLAYFWFRLVLTTYFKLNERGVFMAKNVTSKPQ